MSIITSITSAIKDIVNSMIDLFDGDEKPDQLVVENKIEEAYKLAQDKAKEEDRELTTEEESELGEVVNTLIEERVQEKVAEIKEAAPVELKQSIEKVGESIENSKPKAPRKYLLNRKARRFMRIMGWREDQTANGLIDPKQDVHPKVYSFVNQLMNDKSLTKEKKREIFAKFFAK